MPTAATSSPTCRPRPTRVVFDPTCNDGQPSDFQSETYGSLDRGTPARPSPASTAPWPWRRAWWPPTSPTTSLPAGSVSSALLRHPAGLRRYRAVHLDGGRAAHLAVARRHDRGHQRYPARPPSSRPSRSRRPTRRSSRWPAPPSSWRCRSRRPPRRPRPRRPRLPRRRLPRPRPRARPPRRRPPTTDDLHDHVLYHDHFPPRPRRLRPPSPAAAARGSGGGGGGGGGGVAGGEPDDHHLDGPEHQHHDRARDDDHAPAAPGPAPGGAEGCLRRAGHGHGDDGPDGFVRHSRRRQCRPLGAGGRAPGRDDVEHCRGEERRRPQERGPRRPVLPHFFRRFLGDPGRDVPGGFSTRSR